MNELEEFGKMYINNVRDHVLNRYVGGDLKGLTEEEAGILFKVYATMTTSQWEATRILLQLVTDNQIMTLLSLTNYNDSPYCIVNREEASQAGLTSITHGMNGEKLFEWIAKYSQFTYQPQGDNR